VEVLTMELLLSFLVLCRPLSWALNCSLTLLSILRAEWGQPCVHTGSEMAQAAVRASGVKLCALGRDGLALTEAGYDCTVLPKEPSTQVCGV
jgi:hypothetical protein